MGYSPVPLDLTFAGDKDAVVIEMTGERLAAALLGPVVWIMPAAERCGASQPT
ncbi:hypothetical protein [Streptomyces sp. NPDC016172]|uniref:hypothetical protein n=1 Tax=Streptomyces sp. NPDC016172 TaxID=3364964 RepID=UPI0036F5FE66